MALDVQTQAFYEEMVKGSDPDAPAMHERTPEDARTYRAGLAALSGPAPTMARVEDHTIEQPDGILPDSSPGARSNRQPA